MALHFPAVDREQVGVQQGFGGGRRVMFVEAAFQARLVGHRHDVGQLLHVGRRSESQGTRILFPE